VTRKGVGQVAVDCAAAVFVAHDDLVEIDVRGKLFQRGAGFGRGRILSAELKWILLIFDAVVDEAGQGVLGSSTDGEAGVVLTPEVRVEARVARVLGAQAVEKMDRLEAAFEKAERFGFEAKVRFLPDCSLTRAMCSTQCQSFGGCVSIVQHESRSL